MPDFMERLRQLKAAAIKSNNEYSSCSSAKKEEYFPRRIHTTDWDTKPPCAVIVTIYTKTSYDNLFRAVKQESPNPDFSIALFEMEHGTIPIFLDHLQNSAQGDSEAVLSDPQRLACQQVMDAISKVEPNSVVFNFECCGHCSDKGFACSSPQQRTLTMLSSVMPFVKRLIDAGYMVMFGDFSLKALIHDWDTALLGPNPFQRVGCCHFYMSLTFNSQQLLACPSGQLQSLGRLNDGISTACLKCLGSTIVCTLKEESEYTANNDMYTLEVLSIATQMDGNTIQSPLEDALSMTIMKPQHRLLEIGEHKGYLGHALLKYRSGGMILVSTGHWIELTRVDANEEHILREMTTRYGQAYSDQLSFELSSYGTDIATRTRVLSMNATYLIQSSSPSSYSYSY